MRWITQLAFVLILAIPARGDATTRTLLRRQTDVSAPFEKTWLAVLAQFAERKIPVAKVDEKKGVIISKTMTAGTRRCASGGVCADTTYYSCGSTTGIAGHVDYPAQTVSYEARVRGDSTKSTMSVTATYTLDLIDGRSHVQHDCDSQGRFERDMETAVKLIAERSE